MLYAKLALAKRLYGDWYTDVDLAKAAQELNISSIPFIIKFFRLRFGKAGSFFAKMIFQNPRGSLRQTKRFAILVKTQKSAQIHSRVKERNQTI